MALIKCDECGGQISDRAPHCPHCGATARMRSPAVALLLGVVGAGLAGLMVAVSSTRQASGAESARAMAPMVIAGVLVGIAVVLGIVVWVRTTRR